jgi:DNA-binding MarR family transcriptional regulator
MATNEPNNDKVQIIEDIDRTIHAPTRLKILACLAVVEKADFNYLLHQTGLTRGNLSPNLRKLEEANYVRIQKEFVDKIPRTLIHLTDDGRAALETYRDSMQSVLNDLLGDQ